MDPRGIRLRPYIDYGVQIITVSAPPVHQSKKQAGLLELLEKIFGNGRGKLVLKALSDVAARRASKADAGYGWDMLLEGNLDRWGESFTGKYHCEAALGSLEKQHTIPPESSEKAASDFSHLVDIVGVSVQTPSDWGLELTVSQDSGGIVGASERCCLCCERFSSAFFDQNVVFSATSGRVYPWAPPTWYTGELARRRVWEKLHSKVIYAMDRLGIPVFDLLPWPNSGSRDPEGGSMSGLDGGGGPREGDSK